MNQLHFSALNVNSLVRSSGGGKSYFSPYHFFLSNTTHILFLSDTRMNDNKIEFLEKSFCKGETVGAKKQRIFSTSCNTTNKTGGVTILIPGIYDEVLKVIHTERDMSPIPRHILLVAQIIGGPKIMLGAVYGAPGGKVEERAKVFRLLYNQIYKISNRFATSTLFLAGDFNISLDKLDEQAKDKITLSKIIQDFCLNDAFITSPPEVNEKEKLRLSKQGISAHWSQDGFTYYPKILGNRPNRIDAIFTSAILEANVIDKVFCLSDPLPYSDHKSIHLSFSWSHAGIPLGETKVPFAFKNHLLHDKKFLKILKGAVKESIVENYRKLGGQLSDQCIGMLKAEEAEDIIFDRVKNSRCSFSAIDQLEMIIDKIEAAQSAFLRRRSKGENAREKLMREKVEDLEKIKSPSRTEQKLRISAQKDLADFLKEKTIRVARDYCLEAEVLGESGTKFFLRSRVARRNKAIIRQFQKKDGTITHNSYEIEKEFFEHYQNLLECQDPFNKEAFYAFIEPLKDQIGRITEEDYKSFENPISLQELKLAIKKMNLLSCSGPNGVSGKLLEFIHILCPKILLQAINQEILEGQCQGKSIMQRRIIFIPKPNSEKINIKRFRPISLLNLTFRLADTCIVRRLCAGLERGKILPSFVSAYRKGHSVLDAIISLQCFIENAKNTGRKMAMVSWDITGAFDKCSKLMILEIFEKILCFPPRMIRAIEKMPIGAQARLCVNLAETRFPQIAASQGCPQGLGSSGQAFTLAALIIQLRLIAADISTFKLKLTASRSMTALECYTDDRWQQEAKPEPMPRKFKSQCAQDWKKISANEKRKFSGLDRKISYEESNTNIDVPAIVAFSDDGFLFLEYNTIEDILKVLSVFEEFGQFSGLLPNKDKTRITTVNFTFSDQELETLIQEGFEQSMISDGNQPFSFLGNTIIPNDLHAGALSKLNDINENIKTTAEAFGDGVTLKGRRVVSGALMTSKLYSSITAFDISEKELAQTQKKISNFVHKKRILGGSSKFLPYNKGGIRVPKVFEKQSVARAALIKGLYTKIINKETLPSWGYILIKTLNFIGYKSLSCLFKTLGQADLKFIYKHLTELGFHSLASLFSNIESIRASFDNNRAGTNKKKNNKNKGGEIFLLQPRLDAGGRAIRGGGEGSIDKYGVFHNLPDPPPHWASLSTIGSSLDKDLVTRNKKNLWRIWSDLQSNNGVCPSGELSARNVNEMNKWVANDATTILSLLDKEGKTRQDDTRINIIMNQSIQGPQTLKAMANVARVIGDKMLASVGPSSSSYTHNPLTSWITAGTMNNNTKSLQDQLLTCKYGEIESPAKRKLINAGLTGKVNNRRIGRGLARVQLAFNSVKSERAGIELALGSMRFDKDLRWLVGWRRPCKICGCFESQTNFRSKNMSGGRGAAKHVFLDCAPARFLLQVVEQMAVKITGASLKLNLEMIFLNEIDPKKIRDHKISTNKLRAWYSILGIYRCTLFSLYYKRPHYIDGYLILNRFRENLKIIKSVAAQRGSKIMEIIPLPTHSLSKYSPYQVIYRRVIDETSEERMEDRRNGLRLPKEDGFRSEHRTRIRTTTTKTISQQKRHILINNALKRAVPNLEEGQTINLAEVLRQQEKS